jgi:hypothetical protein
MKSTNATLVKGGSTVEVRLLFPHHDGRQQQGGKEKKKVKNGA